MYLDAAFNPSMSVSDEHLDAIAGDAVGASSSAKNAKGDSYVTQAASWAAFLLRQESSGHGDTSEAMRRAARKAGVPHSRFWSLVRRPHLLKDVGASIYFALHAAYLAECERQQRLLQHELEIARAKAGARSPLVRAAACVAGDQGAGEGVSALPDMSNGPRSAV